MEIKLPIVDGYYYHYKHDPELSVNNFTYKVLGVSKDTENEGEYKVIYKPLYEQDFLGFANFSATALNMFIEEVKLNNKLISRFTQISNQNIITKLQEIEKKLETGENVLVKELKNIVFVDAQNLYARTREEGWTVSFEKFKFYLENKYNAGYIYYFWGAKREDEISLKVYKKLEDLGYKLIFRVHNSSAMSSKKGNVDTDIVFETMKNLIDNLDFNKILIVSGDGDYFRTVEYLISKNKFLKMLFPGMNNNSSLYKKLRSIYCSYLAEVDTKKKIKKETVEKDHDQNEKANLGN